MTTPMTKEALLAALKRTRYDWNKSVMRTCDFCSKHDMTVMVDKMATCAACCDAEYVGNLQEVLRCTADALEAKDKRNAEIVEKYNRIGLAIDAAIMRGVVPESNPLLSRLEMLANYHDSIKVLQSRAEAAEQRVATQSGIILSAKKFISEYAGLGDVGASEFLEILDSAAGITLQIKGDE